jgi:hypothetical protein
MLQVLQRRLTNHQKRRLKADEPDPPALNPFDAPEKSHATHHHREKTSVTIGVQVPKAWKLDKYMSRQEFETIMNSL